MVVVGTLPPAEPGELIRAEGAWYDDRELGPPVPRHRGHARRPGQRGRARRLPGLGPDQGRRRGAGAAAGRAVRRPARRGDRARAAAPARRRGRRPEAREPPAGGVAGATPGTRHAGLPGRAGPSARPAPTGSSRPTASTRSRPSAATPTHWPATSAASASPPPTRSRSSSASRPIRSQRVGAAHGRGAARGGRRRRHRPAAGRGRGRGSASCCTRRPRRDRRAIERELRAGRLVELADDGDRYLMLAELDRAERPIADPAGALAAGAPPWPVPDLDGRHRAERGGAAAWRWPRASATRSTWRSAASVLVITGGPGTGKTTLVRGILAALDGGGLRVAAGRTDRPRRAAPRARAPGARRGRCTACSRPTPSAAFAATAAGRSRPTC